MQRTPVLVTALARGAQWGLPWLFILAVSAGAAYAMAVAFAPGSPAREPMSLAVQEAPPDGSATTERVLMPSIDAGMDPSAGTLAVARAETPPAGDRLSSDDACATSGPMLYVGLNTWIHDPNVPCNDAP
jgi:hypothetical protein